MDVKTVFTKTAKGVTQVNQKTQSLSRESMKVLKAIDGKSNVNSLSEKTDIAVPNLEKVLVQLQKDGYTKKFEVRREETLSDFGDEDDFDFTAASKKTAAAPAPAAATMSRAPSAPTPAPTPVAPDNAAQLEAALSAARTKAKAEAQARADREAQIRARLEVESRARKEAEQRAIEEAKRAQQAAEQARVELEKKLDEEKRQSAALADQRAQMSREQVQKQEEQQRALASARAKAEAEAEALAIARAKADAEARALAEARAMAEAASKSQAEDLAAAQRDLRVQMKAEIEAKVRAEMQELMKADIDESARAEVEAAIAEEAREEARRQLEEQLEQQRISMERIEAESKKRAEEDAKRMLAEQEARIRAEMESRIAALTEEKARIEAAAKEMAAAQVEAAAKAAAESAARLKAESEAYRAAEAVAESQRKLEAENRARLDAELNAKIKAEQEARIQAQARALIESEMREKAEREAESRFAAEKKAREEAEKKAAMEARAREVASRAVAEQVAKRQEVERSTEARIAEERRSLEQQIAEEREARERAEQKAYAEERAEAASHAAQVARLRELSEQAAQHDVEEESGARKKKRRPGPPRESHPIRTAIVLVVFLLVAGVAAIPFWPLGTVNAHMEKAMAEWFHDDVSATGLHISLFPRPHASLDQVSLGKVLDAKANSVKLNLDLPAMFSDRFAIQTLELEDVTISAEALERAAQWARSENRGKAMQIDKIILRSVKLTIPGIAIENFDAEIEFDKKGAIAKATAAHRGGKWTLDMFPDKTVQIEAGAERPWIIDFNSRGMTAPIGLPIIYTDFSAKGSWLGKAIDFSKFDARAFDGSASGNFKVDWNQGVNLSAVFSAQKVQLADLVGTFTNNIAITGRMEGSFTLTAASSKLATLLEKPVFQGSFTAKDGSIGNVDLVQAMRSRESGGRGGQSKFSDLAGQMRVGDGSLRVDKLKLAGGVLFVGGNISVGFAEGNLSGFLSSEIRSAVAQDHANFGLGGTIARPQLKPGG